MALGMSTIKHILLLINFVIVCLAIILFGYGIFVIISNGENAVDHGENIAGGIMIALAISTLVVAIYGCLAAIHESRKRLFIYFVCVCVMLVLDLLLVGMASQGTKDGLAGSVREGFDTLWQAELQEPGALEFYENWLHCCGVNNTDDYHRIEHDIPKSCCVGKDCSKTENVYTEGCQEKFEVYLAGKFLTFSIDGWLLIVGEIAAGFFTWLLLSSLKHHQRRANIGWM